MAARTDGLGRSVIEGNFNLDPAVLDGPYSYQAKQTSLLSADQVRLDI